MTYYRKRPHRSGAIFRVRWSGDVSGARPRHVLYGLVRSAAFQGCKDRRKILKWRGHKAVCGRFQVLFRSGAVERMLPGCCRSSRPAAGRLPPGPRQQPPQQPPSGRAASAWRPGSIRLEAERMLRWPGGCWGGSCLGKTAAASAAALANGSFAVAVGQH